MTSEEQKTNQIGESLNLPTANSPTALIATFADVDEVRESKIQAFTEKLQDNVSRGEDGSGGFSVVHNGIRVYVFAIEENADDECYNESSDLWWSFGNYQCRVNRRGGCFTRAEHNYWFVADSPRDLAVHIIELMDDGRYCSLCDALFSGMSGRTICQECALWELPSACRTCNKTHGRDVNEFGSEELPEHPVCKKRRLAEATQ